MSYREWRDILAVLIAVSQVIIAVVQYRQAKRNLANAKEIHDLCATAEKGISRASAALGAGIPEHRN